MDQSNKNISPADVVPALARCWKKALLCALVLGLLFGLGGLAWGGQRMADAQLRREEVAAYEHALSRYNAQREAIEVQLDALTDSVHLQQDYLDHSLLMALDAYDFYEATLTLQLHTAYQILPGMSYQDPDPTGALRDAYKESLESGALLQAMAQAVEQDVRYMAELLVVRNTENGLAVDVRYATPEGAALLLEQVGAHLEGSRESILPVAEHTVTLTDLGVAHRLDPSLAATQQAKSEKLAETVKAFNTAKTRQNDLVRPTLEPSTWAAVGKRILLIALLGAALGGGLYLAAQLWIFSDGNRILSAGQLEAMGIRFQGLDRGAYTESDLAARLPRGGKLLITGSLAAKRRQQLAEALKRLAPGVEILCLDGITRNVDALEALQSCDGVLLAEVRFATATAEVQLEKQRIEDYGKELIGCLLVDGDKK